MFRFIFQRFKTHFELDRRQAKIYFTLLCFSLLVLCSPLFSYYAYPYFIPQEKWLITIDTLSSLKNEDFSSAQIESRLLTKKRIRSFSEDEWISMGVPTYLAKRIMKFQAKGAVLKNLKDLSKVYGMNESLLAKVKPFIFEEQQEAALLKIDIVKSTKQKIQRTLDINTADSISLIELPGIGPVFASRIIKYRSLLQGYVSKEQYSEIYGLNPFAIEMLNKHTMVEPHALELLSACDYKKLNEHLYLSSKDARYILSELQKNKTWCWTDFALNLSEKASAHVLQLQLYYPCE